MTSRSKPADQKLTVKDVAEYLGISIKTVKELETKKFDLEDRLIEFSLMTIEIVELLPNDRTGNHIAGQLLLFGNVPGI